MTIRRETLLRFDNLTLGYGHHPAVHHLHADIAAGTMLAIVGPNGAGKSTLLKGIVGELTPMQGSIELSGMKQRDIAYLPQQSTVDASFPIAIFDFVAMGLWGQYGAFRGFDKVARRRIDEAIEVVGLGGFEDRAIGQLSGGQLQRARFARLMLQDSPLVLLDEPYAAIDASSVRDLATLLRRWNEEGRTIVCALHDFDHVRQHYAETLLLAREIVACGPTAAVLTEGNQAEARRRAETTHGISASTICHHDEDTREKAGDTWR